MTKHIKINPNLIVWARERADYEQQDLSSRSGLQKLPEWESGISYPTLKQLEHFANTVHVPLGFLFLREPPDVKLPIADFRTLKHTSPRKISPNLLDTLWMMQRRQAWLSDRLVEIGADKLPFVGSTRLGDDPNKVGREMRRVLKFTADDTPNRTWKDAVRSLRIKIENLGVMAVINGVVGNNNSRKLTVEEFRGFALPDEYAPLIFVNGADAKSAQMFTLAHELAHIWLGEEGLSGFELLNPGDTDVERWCDRAAAEFLVPSLELKQHWMSDVPETQIVKKLSQQFKVSPVVIARRALDHQLISQDTFSELYQSFTQRDFEKRSGETGGNFYQTQNFRVGKFFATHVVRAAMEGQIGFKKAYALTGLNGGTFQEYARQIQ